MRPLIRHLRESGQLNAGLILRALLSGNVELFEEALAELSGLPLARVAGSCTTGAAPASARSTTRPGCRPRPIRRSARRSRRCARAASSASRAARARLKRRMIERVLTRCESEAPDEIEPLLTLLRRFAAEAAREEARLFCDELVADDAAIRASIAEVRSAAACAARTRSIRLDRLVRARSGGATMMLPSSTVRPVAVLVRAGIRRSPRAAAGQRAPPSPRVGAVMLADDGAHRIDMLVDQRERDAGEIRRVLDQPAQAVGGARRPPDSRRSRLRP